MATGKKLPPYVVTTFFAGVAAACGLITVSAYALFGSASAESDECQILFNGIDCRTEEERVAVPEFIREDILTVYDTVEKVQVWDEGACIGGYTYAYAYTATRKGENVYGVYCLRENMRVGDFRVTVGKLEQIDPLP